MITEFNLDQFITEKVTRRSKSLLSDDLATHHSTLEEKLRDRKVLVIGGAGTIGSAYIREIVRFGIRELYVFDLNENGLTELVRDLRSTPGLKLPDVIMTYPIDFGHSIAGKIFASHGPFDVVANFAAHKHVRSEKDVFSVEAMIDNNVFKNRKLIDLLGRYPAAHFFCVSTDKAANPVNIMGASKKLLEEMLMSFSGTIPITTARFANVAFSNGSLPLGFIDRINRKQPLSCPQNIRRFFVSPGEAGEICLAASILGQSGDIFFPKLDPEKDMLEFSAIAIDLLASLGLEPDLCASEEEARNKSAAFDFKNKKYPVYFFEPDTSGEKPYEEFFTDNEDLDLVSFNKLGRIRNTLKRPVGETDAMIGRIRDLFSEKDLSKEKIVTTLASYLTSFDHLERGKNLDQRM